MRYYNYGEPNLFVFLRLGNVFFGFGNRFIGVGNVFFGFGNGFPEPKNEFVMEKGKVGGLGIIFRRRVLLIRPAIQIVLFVFLLYCQCTLYLVCQLGVVCSGYGICCGA